MAILALLTVILIDSIGYAIIIPVLAPLLHADPPLMLAQETDAVRYLFYGAVVSAYELVMLFSAPILGQLSDRVGRKPVLLLSGLGIAGSYALIAYGVQANLPVLLLVGRVLGGATAGGQAVASAAVIDRSTERTKARNLNLCLFASSCGFVVGPALGGYLNAPLWAMAALGLTACVLALPLQDTHGERKNESLTGLSAALRPIQGLLLVFCLHQLSWGAYFLYAPTFGLERFHLSDGQVGTFLSLLGVGYLVAYGVVNPLLKAHAAPIGLFATLVLMIATPFFPKTAFLAPLPLVIGMAVSVAYGGLVTLMSDRVAPERQGQMMGFAISVTAIATGTSGLLAGWLSGLDYRYPLYFSVAAMAASTLAYGSRR